MLDKSMFQIGQEGKLSPDPVDNDGFFPSQRISSVYNVCGESGESRATISQALLRRKIHWANKQNSADVDNLYSLVCGSDFWKSRNWKSAIFGVFSRFFRQKSFDSQRVTMLCFALTWCLHFRLALTRFTILPIPPYFSGCRAYPL